MTNTDLVITAASAVGTFGDSAADLWQSLMQAQPLARESASLPAGTLSTEISGFDIDRFYPSRDGHRRPRTSQYAMAAAVQAIQQAKLTTDPSIDRDDVGIVYGTGTGPVSLTEKILSGLIEKGMTGVEPLWFQESVFNAPASWVGIEFGFRGPLVALPMGWTAGGHALAMAADMVTFGNAPIALVLLSDELAPIVHRAYRALKLVSPNDAGEQCARLFDMRSNGAILGEGAAALVVETSASAYQRGAQPLARLSGWSITSDAFGLGPKGAGPNSIQAAMEGALKMAGRDKTPVVFSGAYGVRDAARVEAAAIHETFRDSEPVVTNIRGTVGEARGTTSLWNVIAAISALNHGMVPPTVGYEQPDPEIALDVTREPRMIPHFDSVLCNAFWVNGVNTSIVLESVK